MPSMVYIDSDVQVVEDYQEPIFYSSNYYWRYDGGTWYRSSNYQSGWVRFTANVPAPILRIQTPASYIHYHGEAHAAAGASAGNNPTPVMAHERDKARSESKEDRKEAKEDRKEAKEDRKEAKKQH